MSIPHHQGHADMGLARRKDMDDDVLIVNDEARRRIDSARVRQIMFQVKNIAPTMSDDDAAALAVALLETSADGMKPTGDEIRRRLQISGRTPERASRIASAVGL